jgi:hypothetical protein
LEIDEIGNGTRFVVRPINIPDGSWLWEFQAPDFHKFQDFGADKVIRGTRVD